MSEDPIDKNVIRKGLIPNRIDALGTDVLASAIGLMERTPLPDWITRGGIDFLVERTRRRLATRPVVDAPFARMMALQPIALHAEDANKQHYELPAAFFGLVLGPSRKYSCCLYADAATSLVEAENAALSQTMIHADIRDGQRILELGCGWGSLSLAMARRFPAASISAVSNSASQKAYIDEEARRAGLGNLTVTTADMNSFEPGMIFDRVVSVEMFEHMTNWQGLLERIKGWMAGDGRLFLHVFSHRSQPYRFDHADKTNWIARHFFTGGIMPSHDLIRQFNDLFALEQVWQWNGRHYQRTALDWLSNFDAQERDIETILREVYGADAVLWKRRWRLFFLATAGLFGSQGGSEWGVSHYRLRPAA